MRSMSNSALQSPTSSCTAATAHLNRSSASWKLRLFWARYPAMARGDGAWSVAPVQDEERPGKIVHPSCLMIARYCSSTANNFVKLQSEGYLKQGAKYPSRMNPLSLQSVRGSVCLGSAWLLTPGKLPMNPAWLRRWTKSCHSAISSPQPGAPFGNPSCL